MGCIQHAELEEVPEKAWAVLWSPWRGLESLIGAARLRPRSRAGDGLLHRCTNQLHLQSIGKRLGCCCRLLACGAEAQDWRKAFHRAQEQPMMRGRVPILANPSQSSKRRLSQHHDPGALRYAVMLDALHAYELNFDLRAIIDLGSMQRGLAAADVELLSQGRRLLPAGWESEALLFPVHSAAVWPR